jgi:hypothetical protein
MDLFALVQLVMNSMSGMDYNEHRVLLPGEERFTREMTILK